MTIAAITASQLQAVLQQQGADPAASAAQAGRFEALMNQPLTPPANGADPTTDNLAGQLIQTQDHAEAMAMHHMEAYSQNLPQMSMQETMGESMKITMELATMQFDMQAKMGVVTSSKSSAETLMKNQ